MTDPLTDEQVRSTRSETMRGVWAERKAQGWVSQPKTPLADRFWAKVKKTDGCWLWTGTTTQGYGQIFVNGRHTKAHRVAWAIAYGPPSPELDVLHRCDNPPCVRPDHLFLGTAGDNIADARAKGRMIPARGERSHLSKLRTEDIPRIRHLMRVGVPSREIALAYGVHRKTIEAVARGKTWKHVPRAES